MLLWCKSLPEKVTNVQNSMFVPPPESAMLTMWNSGAPCWPSLSDVEVKSGDENRARWRQDGTFVVVGRCAESSPGADRQGVGGETGTQ